MIHINIYMCMHREAGFSSARPTLYTPWLHKYAYRNRHTDTQTRRHGQTRTYPRTRRRIDTQTHRQSHRQIHRQIHMQRQRQRQTHRIFATQTAQTLSFT